MGKARDSLGLCPQHNMLFPTLTVFEHLIFFGMLKGISWSEAKREGQQYIQKLNLVPKMNVPSTSLSGGMKRKLHLAMALTGDSKVLILDEPTSGMDPEARRGMWDTLQVMKEGRTIMLTTHFMEEADVLGDRIAIMSDGQVKCCGSPMFLKTNLGAGYSLTVTKDSSTLSEPILQLVQKHISTSKIKNENSLEIIVALDITGTEKLAALAEDLDQFRDKLGYSSFGFTKTTVEDVFLNIANDNDKPDISEVEDVYKEYEVTDIQKVEGSEMLLNHFKGQFIKRIIATRRMWKTYFYYSLLAAIPLIVFTATNKPSHTYFEEPKPFALYNFEEYDNNNVFYIDNTMMESNLFEKMKSYLSSLHTNDEMVTNVEKVLLDAAKEDDVKFGTTNLISVKMESMNLSEFSVYQDRCGAGWTKPQVLTMLYNAHPYHIRPLARNIISNVIMLSSSSEQQLMITSHPMVYNGRVSSNNKYIYV